ncbi:alpha/beta fold hydrolase, partial [Streptomyces microflavus]|uniref:alpha/beta fold hydrolase n=1 Tax=Streptomyces microflavus TaxID=1919 RepID=UPI003F4BF67C
TGGPGGSPGRPRRRRCSGVYGSITPRSGLPGAHDVKGLPVTVAWGTRDRILLRRQGIRAKQVIPGARLVRLPGCGHVPMNDDPALVARVILDTSR